MGKLLATVDDLKITTEDVEFMKKNMNPQILQQFQGNEQAIVQEIISQKLLYLDAKEKHLLDSEEYVAEFNRVKENYASQYAIRKLLDSITVTDEEAKSFYEANKSIFDNNEQVRASHILVEAKEKAEEILSKIKKGDVTFEDAAKEHSSCPSKAQGGDLGYFGKGQMVKEFETKAFSMGINEISEPVKTQFGYHIIKLTDKKEKQDISFEEIKDKIKESLIMQKQQQEYLKTINELAKKHKIETF